MGTKQPEKAQKSSLESIEHLLRGAVAVPNKGSLCGSIWTLLVQLGTTPANMLPAGMGQAGGTGEVPSREEAEGKSRRYWYS